MQYGFYEILQLIGSLGLFLFGMKVMSDALLNLAGNKMRSFLARMTSNRVFGIATGFLITSVIQSSSATTLMVVSFANASLLTLTESISVIMGANIGTTITAWLITILGFKVSMSAIALPLVGFGFAFTFIKKEKAKDWGGFIIGFAILFIGLQFLKEAMPNINENPEILAFLSKYTDLGFWSILLFLLIGTVLTVVIQSSSATMALTLIMTAQGWIPFEMAAAMVLGENVGTTITANLAAIVGNFNAKRTARAHLIFNLLGVLWMLILFYPFLRFISWLSTELGSESPYVSAAAVPVAISLFHTAFNIANTLLLVWFVKPIAKIVQRFVPEKMIPERAIDEPKFLTKESKKYPETAIVALLEESKYLFEHAIFQIVANGLNIHRDDIKSELRIREVIEKSTKDLKTDVRDLYYRKVKSIYGQILTYMSNVQTKVNFNNEQSERLTEIQVANRKMVRIIREITEISRSISTYLNSENEHLGDMYNSFRKKVAKTLRIIYLFRTEKDRFSYHEKLIKLSVRAQEEALTGNRKIDKLIRDNLISVDMASSLVNDNDHINNIIKELINVAHLLYEGYDPLTENNGINTGTK